MRLESLPPPAREPADISAWLGTLRKVLRLPENEASGILEELEDHLQQRVRDLQIAGHGDAESVRLALNELGDAAVMARRFRSASGYRRRRLAMNIAVIGLASGAALLSAVAVSRGPAQPQAGARSAYVDTRPDSPQSRLTFIEGRPASLADLLQHVGKALELPLHVRWDRMEQRGISKDSEVVVVGKDLEIAEVFRRINEGEPFQHAKLDYRTDHGVLEVADREFFDRRERVLVSYDLGALLKGSTEDARQRIIDDLRGAITEFASPEDWRDNGGDLGALSIVDSRLFVEAPPRMHRQVQWILDQLKAEAEQKPRAAAEGMAEVRRYPLSHITAHEALGALQKLEAIRAIDFSRFTVDQRNNAIIGSGDASVHDRVAGALAVLDRPAVQKSDAHGVPILSDIPVVGEMYKLPEKPAKSEPVSSRSFPFTAPNSGELAWVDEIYANGRIGSLEFKTNGGIMTVTGPDRDVVELGRFVNLVSSRPQSERAAIESHLKQLKADVAARKEALTQLAFDDPKRAQLESALPHLEATIRDLETILNPPGC